MEQVRALLTIARRLLHRAPIVRIAPCAHCGTSVTVDTLQRGRRYCSRRCYRLAWGVRCRRDPPRRAYQHAYWQAHRESTWRAYNAAYRTRWPTRLAERSELGTALGPRPRPPYCCRACGEEFEPVRIDARYCSRYCRRWVAQRGVSGPAPSRVCGECGVLFLTTRARQRFCSRACKERARQQRRKQARRLHRMALARAQKPVQPRTEGT